MPQDTSLNPVAPVEPGLQVVGAFRTQSGEPKEGCYCEACVPLTLESMRMVLCLRCGNKRCPHATDHRNPCTGSNEPGQKGSSWEHVALVR